MIAPTIGVILKAFGYTVALLAGTFSFAMIVWPVTANKGRTTCTFWGSLFLGILVVLADELKKCEALVLHQPHEQTAVTAHPNTPVLTQYVPSQYKNHCRSQFAHFRPEIGSVYRLRTFQVSTESANA